MSEKCYKCFRPLDNCYCKYTKKIGIKTKFVLLMHPKEFRKQKTGTGRLASLCLDNSEVFVGIDFTNHERLNQLLNDPKYYPVLMYPTDKPVTASTFSSLPDYNNRIPLVIIIDSTWFCSKKMIKLSTNINTLPRISFEGQYKSIFTFKTEPAEYCVSTIESAYYLVKEFQKAGLEDSSINPEPLMDVFKKMIEFQLQKENERITSGLPGTHPYDKYYNTIKEIPDYLKK